jgi:branched-chain amino acid transport system permease protein
MKEKGGVVKIGVVFSVVLLGILALTALPLYAESYTVILLANILMYVAITISWAMFSGPTGYISLAPAAFFGIGVYTTAFLGHTLPLAAIIGIGGIASFGLAVLVGALTLRLKGTYFTIFTFGLGELIRHLLLFWEITVTGTRGRLVVSVDSNTVYWVMLAIFAICLLTAYLMRNAKYGLALNCIGQEEEATAHSGVNVTRIKVATFAVSALFIGATGAIMATKWSYIDPYIAFNPMVSFMPVLMGIFGGMGHFLGPVLGAGVFSYLEEYLIASFPYHYMLIFGVIMLASILYLPDGMVGLAQKVWQRLLRRRYADT